MNTKQLRQKILDLAIRGQLVPQDSNDEPASVLLEKIRAEKQTLIEQKKIKKDKKSSYITCDLSPYRKYTEHFADGSSKDITDEIPFEIPENWVWCRLGEIGVSELGKTLNSNKDTGELTPYLCSINIHWTCINLEEVKKTRSTKEEQRKYILLKNDLLVCEGGDIGRCFVWNFPIPMYYQNALHRIRFYNEINPFFFKFAIEYYKNIHILDKYSKGVTIKHLTKTALHSICFPLPPLSEQRRIVGKIEELLALVDDLEANKTDLQSYIKQAKSKVLEMAVRGELVPQNPDDEPASVLLERIKKEQKSSKSKGKTTEHNTHYEEELPFDIPENWVWCRLGEVCDFERGITFPSSAKQFQYFENSIPCIRTTNVQEELELDDIWFIDKSYTKNNEKKLLKINDIIMSSANSKELVGKTCLVKKIDTKFTFGGFVLVIRNKFDYNKYIFYLLRNIFFKGYFRRISTQTTNIANINIALLEEIIIPLPPLAEQHRIVEKIEHIFAVLEELEENIL